MFVRNMFRISRFLVNTQKSALRWNMRRYCTIETAPIEPKPKKKRFISLRWKSVIITVSFGVSVYAVVKYFEHQHDLELESRRKRIIGKAAIGGDFELVDQNGKPCSSKDLLGQWLLIYFGFSHCPDVCPDELEKIVKVVKKINSLKALPNIQPVFISVDPYRDTPEIVGKYTSEFYPDFIALTGTEEQVAKACKTYRVYFSPGPKDDDNDYIVDHSIVTYFVNPDGEFIDYFGQTSNSDIICSQIQLYMAKYKRLKDWN